MQVAKFAKETLTWVAPAVGIPALRYFQDQKEQRKELFIRDASTYSIGALLYLGLFFGGKSLLKHLKPTLNEHVRDLSAFLVAITANIAYAGIGAVRISQKFQSPTPKQTIASWASTPFQPCGQWLQPTMNYQA
jgi:hypothetical protein